MKWYADYLSIYDKPFTQAPQAVINQVKDKIRQLATHAPLVSVVVCENQHNYPVEILVINNHSTDHTEEVLKELGVTYFNEYRKGPGFARQCGLNHARGKYHLCIDADTLYPPQYISTMIKVLQDKEVAGQTGTQCTWNGFCLPHGDSPERRIPDRHTPRRRRLPGTGIEKIRKIKIRHRPQSPCPYRLWHYFGRRIPVQQFQKTSHKRFKKLHGSFL